MSGLKPSTLAAQALGWIDPQTRAVVPPLIASATYERGADGTHPGGYSYSRDQNPTYDRAEALLAELEGGTQALLFASGMAAATTVFETLPLGAHVVAPSHIYWTIRLWLQQLAAAGRIALDFVPNGDADALRATVRKGETHIVWVETPANPMCTMTDIAQSADIAHAAGARVVVDSTVATPVLCQPLRLGADLVMHSATKQLNGHSDVLAGALVTARKDEAWERIAYERAYRGAVLGPFEAWLLLRGMRTLFLRVPAAAANAQVVAQALSQLPAVQEVMYPGLPDHPGHSLASRQMTGGFGMMLSFRPVGGAPAAQRVVAALQVFKNATSLGGVESLAEHRAPAEGPGTNVPDDLIRLSLGIESPDDLVEDLRHALKSASV